MTGICRDNQVKKSSSKDSLVLPPPCHGSNTAHLQTAGREAWCPRTTTQGLKLGTLSKKKEHRIVPNPKFLYVRNRQSVSCLFIQSSSVVLQSNMCAFKHWTAQFIYAQDAWCRAAELVIHPIRNTIACSDKLVLFLMGTCEIERSVSSAQYRPINSAMLCGPEGKVWKLIGSPLHERPVKK